MKQLTIIAILFVLTFPYLTLAVSVTKEEQADAKQWYDKHFTQDILPFSFIYDGKPSGELLKDWKCEKVTKNLTKIESNMP